VKRLACSILTRSFLRSTHSPTRLDGPNRVPARMKQCTNGLWPPFKKPALSPNLVSWRLSSPCMLPHPKSRRSTNRGEQSLVCPVVTSVSRGLSGTERQSATWIHWFIELDMLPSTRRNLLQRPGECHSIRRVFRVAETAAVSPRTQRFSPLTISSHPTAKSLVPTTLPSSTATSSLPTSALCTRTSST
jgi:hypothetical protein